MPLSLFVVRTPPLPPKSTKSPLYRKRAKIGQKHTNMAQKDIFHPQNPTGDPQNRYGGVSWHLLVLKLQKPRNPVIQ